MGDFIVGLIVVGLFGGLLYWYSKNKPESKKGPKAGGGDKYPRQKK